MHVRRAGGRSRGSRRRLSTEGSGLSEGNQGLAPRATRPTQPLLLLGDLCPL